ncbi:MAG: PAS domain-containing sensor histidine kinase [Magnetococcus sp. YQC-3]
MTAFTYHRRALTIAHFHLQERGALLRLILTHAPDAIITIDVDGCVHDLNPAAESLFGYSRDRLLGQDMAEHIIPPELRSVHREALQRRLHPVGGWGLFRHKQEVSGLHADGHRLDLEMGVIGFSLSGRVYFTAFLRDISERKQLLQSLRDALAAAESANQMKSDFLANISHELRTPLNAILQFAVLAKRKWLEGNQEAALAFLERLLASEQRLLRFVANIETVARIQAGDWACKPVMGDLMPLVRRVVQEVRARPLSHSLTWQLAGEEEAWCLFDAQSIMSVLEELVENAHRFSVPGGVVQIDAEVLAAEVHLTIRDSGPGIPVGEEEGIFFPFVIGSHTRTSAGGTGLGLTIARGLARQNGGTVVAANRKDGLGTAFTLILPRERQESG